MIILDRIMRELTKFNRDVSKTPRQSLTPTPLPFPSVSLMRFYYICFCSFSEKQFISIALSNKKAKQTETVGENLHIGK